LGAGPYFAHFGDEVRENGWVGGKVARIEVELVERILGNSCFRTWSDDSCSPSKITYGTPIKSEVKRRNGLEIRGRMSVEKHEIKICILRVLSQNSANLEEMMSKKIEADGQMHERG